MPHMTDLAGLFKRFNIVLHLAAPVAGPRLDVGVPTLGEPAHADFHAGAGAVVKTRLAKAFANGEKLVRGFVDPPQVDEIPVARRVGDVTERRANCRARIGADRAVKRAPVIERIREHAQVAESAALSADAPGDDPDRLIAFADDQHAEPLALRIVAPTRFEPLERLEERVAGGLREQLVPHGAKRLEVAEAIDFDDVDHGGIRSAYGNGRSAKAGRAEVTTSIGRESGRVFGLARCTTGILPV